MGRQINFYLVGDDETEFTDVILRAGGAFVDEWGMAITEERAIQAERKVYIKFLQSQVKMNSSGRVDYPISDVIEFKRSMIRDRNIYLGRLWVEIIGFDERGRIRSKDVWLEDKYSSYKRWITRHCKISRDKTCYIGQKTYRLYKEQGFRTCTNSKYDAEFD